ncbi:MAG: 3-deoxy-8-phosphooctulonate synthase [Bacteroidetes bacterium]|jgi:2-dehydro-3-deoxyphosphooctonate aldolase (KDO 8-P synthase)|nr:3-deoxy-8-phosphooctulonate synthase [Bacteroidota bacterium]
MEFLAPLFNQKNTHNNFFLLAGPCVVENEEVLFKTASTLKNICEALSIPLIFKSSFTKANRSSANSFTSIGHEKALNMLANVKTQFDLPLVTDIHTESDAELAAQYVDVLQIPAFLCRQTSLLVAAANTNKIVNIKKGQFLSPEAMEFALKKVTSQGNEKVMLTERGTTFGYQDLIVDYRGIPIMKQFGKPVIMDCTHALQQPNQPSGVTGGKPELIETIAKCAIAAGADGLFIETHPDPSNALSDGANMLPLHEIKALLEKLIRIRQAIL